MFKGNHNLSLHLEALKMENSKDDKNKNTTKTSNSEHWQGK